jgi:hypothetical protein
MVIASFRFRDRDNHGTYATPAGNVGNDPQAMRQVKPRCVVNPTHPNG